MVMAAPPGSRKRHSGFGVGFFNFSGHTLSDTLHPVKANLSQVAPLLWDLAFSVEPVGLGLLLLKSPQEIPVNSR